MFYRLCAFCAALSLTLFSAALAAENTGQNPVVAGDRISINSQPLGEERDLIVSLPKSYQTSPDTRYPVLYTLDGETHFSLVSGMVDWLSQSAGEIPEMIIVAIPNTATSRGRDLTAAKMPNGAGGGAALFREFISSEVIPYIDRTYRTQPFRVLSGHSLAGLFVLDTMMTEPDLFGAYIAVSPYLIANQSDEGLLARAGRYFENTERLPVTLELSLGDDEGNLRPHYDKLVSVIEASAPQGLEWQSKIIAGHSHMSAPGAAIYEALRQIFSDLALAGDSAVFQNGVTAVKAYYEDLSERKYGYKLSAEKSVNTLAAVTQQRGDIKGAIEILKINAADYPDSWQAFANLSGMLAADRQLEQARDAAVRAQKLAGEQNHPAAEFLKMRVQQLEAALSASPSQ